MSERGVFAVDRGIWEHDVLSENLPLSRREAWLWLLSEAAWKPHRRRLSGYVIEVKRGQVAASLRFIASKWRWSEPKVRRFLTSLKNEGMIDAASDAGVTVITVCKYDEYQRVSLPIDAPSDSISDAGATQERRKVEDKEDKEVDRIGDARAGASGLTDGSKALATAFWRALGFNSPIAVPPEYAGTDWRAISWEAAGWTADMIGAEVSRIGPGKPLSYYEKVFATAHAKLQAPLPIVEIKPAETITVSKHAKTGTFDAAYDRVLDKLNAGFGGPAPQERLRVGEGETDARLLAYRRRE